MKKLPTCVVLLTSSILVGCDKYDLKISQDLQNLQTVEFYTAHEEKALKVQNECKQIEDEVRKIHDSLPKSERKEFEDYFSNIEKNCNNADRGLHNIAEQKREQKYAQEQIEREQQEAKEQAEKEARKDEIIKYMKDTYASYEQLPWQDGLSKILSETVTSTSHPDSDPAGKFFYDRNKDMSSIDRNMIKKLGNSNIESYIEYGNELALDDKNELALIYSANQLWQKGLAELKAKNYAELAVDESYCKKDKRKYSACDVWRQAISEKRAEIVKNYTLNYDSLKTDYNQCVAQLEDYLKSVNVGKNDTGVPYNILQGIQETEKNIYAKYPCSETEEALRKLNLNFDHYEKLD